MRKKNEKSASVSTSRRRRSGWSDPDDAPEITDDVLDRATIVKDGELVPRPHCERNEL